MNEEYTSLEDIRAAIDTIDRQIVRLMADRAGLVQQAAKFKKDTDAVRAPARVEQVVGKARMLAGEYGLAPEVAERVYRTMIACFVEQETAEFDRRKEEGIKA